MSYRRKMKEHRWCRATDSCC